MLGPIDNRSELNLIQLDNKTRQLKESFANPAGKDHQKLKEAAQQFEAVFVKQLLDAMDKTIDRSDSLLNGGQAEEIFRGMMNEETAKNMTSGPHQKGFGLAEAIYRQMSKMIETPPEAGGTSTINVEG